MSVVYTTRFKTEIVSLATTQRLSMSKNSSPNLKIERLIETNIGQSPEHSPIRQCFSKTTQVTDLVLKGSWTKEVKRRKFEKEFLLFTFEGGCEIV